VLVEVSADGKDHLNLKRKTETLHRQIKLETYHEKETLTSFHTTRHINVLRFLLCNSDRVKLDRLAASLDDLNLMQPAVQLG